MKMLRRLRRMFIRSMLLAAAGAVGSYFYDSKNGRERRNHAAETLRQWRTDVATRFGLSETSDEAIDTAPSLEREFASTGGPRFPQHSNATV